MVTVAAPTGFGRGMGSGGREGIGGMESGH
jgi:hypothetical protein